MSQDRINAQLKGLEHPSALFRRQAAFGVFALLRSQPAAQQGAVQGVLLTCLTTRHADVVDESLRQLLQLLTPGPGHSATAGLTVEEALHLLLLALTSAGAATAPLLAAGLIPLCQLIVRSAAADSSASEPLAAALARQFPAGSRHPLCSGLLSHPAAAAAVITAAVNWLAAAVVPGPAPSATAAGGGTGGTSAGQPPGLSAVWSVLQPFFSFVLLADAAGDSSSSSSSQAEPSGGGSAGVGAAATSMCLSQLLCLCSCSPAAARLLLPFLLRQLLLWRLGTAAERSALIQALSDVLDVLAAHAPEDDSHDTAINNNSHNSSSSWCWWRRCCQDVGSLLLLVAMRAAAPVAAGGSSGGAAAMPLLLALLWRLGGELAPGLLQQQLLPLGWLLVVVQSQPDQAAVMQLISAQLRPASSSQAHPREQLAAVEPWQAAALRLPLLQQLVFSTRKQTKAWAAALLAQLKRQQQQQQGAAVPAAVGRQTSSAFQLWSAQGPLASVAAVQQLLAAWWAEDGGSSSKTPAVLTWLDSFTSSLQLLSQRPGGSTAAAAAGQRAAGSGSSALTLTLAPASVIRDLEGGGDEEGEALPSVLMSTGAAAWSSSAGVSPSMQLLLAALLQHQQRRVVAAAAGALQQLLLLVPTAAPGFLPLVLQQLRAAATAGAAGCTAALLQLLPAMCVDPSSSALVWKMLQPVLAVTAPPSHTRLQPPLPGRQVSGTSNGLARSVAVQLAVRAWQLTGRGWNRAEAAVNGCMRPAGAGGAAAAAAAAAAEPLELRLLRATAMSDVMCGGAAGPRSLELLGSLAEALGDPAPAVAAAALRGLASLMADDDLDFYAAWPVLTRTLLAAAGPKAALAAVGADGSGGSSSGGSSNGGSRLCAAGSAVAGWVGLLRFGADDAAAQPELAGAVVAVLQLAATAADPRVRAAAYSSLSCWPLPLLAELELSPTAAEYIAPLAAEAAAAAAAARPQLHQQGSGGRQQLLLKAHRAAMAAAELLAAAAIRHEHANRRQFLAAAKRGSSSSSAGSGTAAGSSSSNAAAVEREEAALRHRLMRVLPAALTSPAATPAAGDAAAAGAPSAGALLLLWQPEASSSSSSSYQQVLAEVSSRWAPDAAAGCAGVAAGAGLSAAAWAAFMSRWCAVPAVAPEALLQQLTAAASSALPAAAAAAAAAAAGLAAARVASEGQLEELMRHLTAVIDDDDRPSLVVAAAASSLARLLPVLHPGDWPSRERCVSRLYAALMDCCSSDSDSGSSGSVEGRVVAAAAAAEALGFAGVALLQQHQDGSSLFGSSAASDAGGQADQAVGLACSCLGLLLSVLRGLWGGRVAGLAAALDQLLLGLPEQQRELVLLQEQSPGQEHAKSLELTANALRSCLALLAALHNKAQHANSGGMAAATAAAAGGFASFVLQQLAAVASDVTAGGSSSHSSSSSSSRLAWQLAVLAAAPAAAGTELLTGRMSHQQLAAATAHAKAVATAAAGAGEGAALVMDGRLRAAAAVSWAQLVLMARAAVGSSSSSGDGQELSGVVSWLAAAATAPPNNAAAKAPGVAATRAGAAAGLAVLLGVDLAAGSCGEWTAAVVAAAAGGGSSGPVSAFGSGGGSSWGLLAPPGSNSLPQLQLVRSCLKALEAAAAVRGGSTAAYAAWLLAAACVAAGSRVAGRPGAAAGRQRQQVAAAGPIAALPMLQQYPAAGALRPLAERALALQPTSAPSHAPGGGATALAAALEVAAAVRCLAGAPRLPAADWAGLCRRLIAAGGSTAPAAAGAAAAAALQLQEAAVLLLLSHCQAPGLELTGVLDALLDPSGFRQLQPYVQGLVLGQLGRLLAALPAARGVVLLHGLPGLIADLATRLGLGRAAAAAAGSGSGQGRAGSSRDGVVVFLAAWAGLTQLAEAAAAQVPPFVGQQQQRQLAAALQGAVQRLLLLLPPLQLPCAGLLLQVVRADVAAALGQLQEQQQLLHAWGVAESCTDSGSGSDAAGSLQQQQQQQQQQLLADDDTLLLWSGAVACLCSLQTDSLLQVTEVPVAALHCDPAAGGLAAGLAPSLHAAVQARCLLVLASRLSWKDLATARNAFLTCADPSIRQDDTASTEAMLLPLSLACATAPQAGLLHQLQELAAAAVAGVGPAAASRAAALAAGVLAAWLVCTGPGSVGSQPSSAPAGGTAAAAVAAAAAALAERQLALGSSSSSTAALAQLPALLPQLLASHHLAGSRQGFAEAVCAALLTIAAAGGREAAAAVRAAVAAVREALPQVGSRCWQQLILVAAVEESP